MVSPGIRAFVCRRDTELAYQYFLTQKNTPLDRPGFEPTGARRGGGARVGSAPLENPPNFFRYMAAFLLLFLHVRASLLCFSPYGGPFPPCEGPFCY